MNTQSPAPGRAGQACRRCHSRKKRCDRSLPQCGACLLASVQCSFQDQNQVSRLYAVSYVRGLEDKVRRLENQLRELDTPVSSHHLPPTTSPSPRSVTESLQPKRGGNTLASELKWLSLEATAERYLGSSSGLSFARLTQAVLQRLRSDQYPFAFETESADDPNGADKSAYGEHAHDPESIASEPIDLELIIDRDRALRLVEYYWSHNHSLYPFVPRVAFMENLNRMYVSPHCASLRSHSWLYTMWMVLAIGSTAWSSITIDEEAESVKYFDKAMEHFEVLLQVSYSFFNKIGPNTWYLVGVGVRVALGMGLHTAPSSAVLSLPLDAQEYRKRLFYSLYMMDRVVSIALGRPFGIQDYDIEVDVFADIDDSDTLPHTVIPQPFLQPSSMAVPLHILALRRISGGIFEQVYSNRNRDLETSKRDVVLQDLHQKLIQWRRAMPFPLPKAKSLPIPHFTTAWYDLNYYQHILMLYRPSPLFPILTLEKVGLIAEASTMCIAQVSLMQQQNSFAFNWLNLFNMFTATLTLIYSITAQPEPLPVYLQRTKALEDLNTVSDLLTTFGRKFPSALKCRSIVQDVIRRLESLSYNGSPSDGQEDSFAHRPDGVEPAKDAQDGAGLAYPIYNTGSPSYDSLQRQVRGSDAIGADSSRTHAPSTIDGAIGDSIRFSGHDLTSSSSPTADFLAHGLGSSMEMELDEDLLQLIGATNGSWSY